MEEDLLVSKAVYEGDRRALRDYRATWRETPYLLAEFCIPPYKIERPISVGCWRTTSYTQSVTVAERAIIVVGPATNRFSQDKIKVTMSQVRIDSFPSLVSIMVTKRDADKSKSDRAYGQSPCSWKDWYAPMENLSISLNEKQLMLTDLDNYQLWKEYRRNSSSKLTYQQWSQCRMQYLIRSDTLALLSENVFSPSTMSLTVEVGRCLDDFYPYDPLLLQPAVTYDLRVTFLYMSESLTLSQNAAAVNSLLLSKQDLNDVSLVAAADTTSLAQYAS